MVASDSSLDEVFKLKCAYARAYSSPGVYYDLRWGPDLGSD